MPPQLLDQKEKNLPAPPAAEGPTLRTEFAVRGMNCSSCAQHVSEAIQRVPGVASATVQLEEGRASVRWATDAKAAPERIVEAVAGAGYEAQIIAPMSETHAEDGDHCGEHGKAGWQLNLWIGVLCTLPLMLGEWVFGWAMERWFHWLAFGLATLVQFLAGAQFYRGAWRQLKVGSSNMDTLVALGSTTSYAYSLWALFSHAAGHLYFMESAAIITLGSVGHWFEARAGSQASSSLRALLNLAPALARRRNPDGSESECSVAALQLNDLIALRPGARIPTDGQVTEGPSAVNESMLTGESVPAEKTPTDLLYGGTVNLTGRLVM